ncbi:hypothetical protein CO151_06490 [bacterium CG_4_9_14_3_um_filter_65_15]|nr:MAG: hypothetical protein CO151_06490 [bacterium CG_4_9_14_3_um_filter_65_15]
MATNPNNHDFTPTELDASLRRLGIQELQERLEFSPLLIDTGMTTGDDSLSMPCCVCKISDPQPLDGNGMLPFPMEDIGGTGLNY